MSPQLVAASRRKLNDGDISGAWRELQRGGDGFASLMAASWKPPFESILTMSIDAQWACHTGEGASGAAYQDANRELCQRYLDFIDATGSLPSTEDIERMDRSVIEARHLPLFLAMGALASKLALELKVPFSWGRAIGLPAERIVTGSQVFADAPFEAALENLKASHQVLKRFGVNQHSTYEGALVSLRALAASGQARRVSPLVLREAKELARFGKVAAAWGLLARHGDGYARHAQGIVQEHGNPHSFFATLVDAHWTRVVGDTQKALKFMEVAQKHVDNYLREIERNDGVLPDTQQIEASYRQAVESSGLPARLAIDSLLSKADVLMDRGVFEKLGIKDFSWAAMLGISRERIVYRSDVFNDLDFNPATELAATVRMALQRHALNFMRPGAFAAAARGLLELVSAGRSRNAKP